MKPKVWCTARAELLEASTAPWLTPKALRGRWRPSLAAGTLGAHPSENPPGSEVTYLTKCAVS